MESLEVRDLTFTYPGGTKPALANISLAVGRGGFVTVCGPSGGGKTTLLRHLKPAMAPRGAKTGGVFLDGTPLEELPPERQAAAVGFVGQSPENQIVTDKVWHELAFGLECLGLETPVIRRRVAEMAAFFGIADWFRRDVSTLSGGQKQLLNLASVMVMQPEILVLDEPTSRLDPVAASDFLAVIGRINRELGTAVVISEHRLEDVLPLSGQALVMDGGAAVCCGAPEQVGETLRRERPDIFLSMPAPMRIWSAVQNDLTCPVTAAQGAQWLRSFAADRPLVPVPERVPAEFPGEPAVSAKELWFRYEKDGPDVLAGFDLAAYPGEILALMGGNGVGKSTALSLLAGLEKPYRGSVKLRGRLAALPQEPLTFFAEDTVLEGLESALAGEGPTDARRRRPHWRDSRPVQALGAFIAAPRRPLRRRDTAGGAGPRAAGRAGHSAAGRAHQGHRRLLQARVRPDTDGAGRPGRGHNHGQSRRGVLRPVRRTLRADVRRHDSRRGAAPQIFRRKLFLHHLRKPHGPRPAA
jgi:energy-coupling factor transporter ATP-binding protein EcfA2